MLRAAAAGEREGLAVVSDYQQLGRGRLRHRWEAPPGSSLLLSLLWRPAAAVELWGSLPLAAGVAVAEAIEALGGPSVGLKWPNDCLIDGRKVAGVLAETTGPGPTGSPAVVLGLGCNVAWADCGGRSSLPPAATSLDLEGLVVDRTELAAALLARLQFRYSEWSRWGSEPALSAWTARALWLGQEVQVELPGRRLAGTLLGVGADGSLRLGMADVELTVMAGDLAVGEASGLRPRAVGPFPH